MNKFRTFQEDDENDTILFSAAEKYVLDHYPNPDRIGCPGPAVLANFVESPAQVDLSDLHGIHIMRCRECTLDLIELRRQRELRLAQEQANADRRRKLPPGITYIAAVILIAAVALVAVVVRHQIRPSVLTASQPDPTPVVADLREDGVSRGTDAGGTNSIVLPAKLLNLKVLLPYYSPAGPYTVFVARERSVDAPLASETGEARATGSRTDVEVRIDLRNVAKGRYYLGTRHAGQNNVYFYPVSLN